MIKSITIILVDSDTSLGINTDTLKAEVKRCGSVVDALRYIAYIIDIGDGGIEHEGCIIPDLRNIARLLESGTITEKAFWMMVDPSDP